ncbi:outer membrane lipoprotein carrier protein LolA [Aurantivibrio infirmus]
MTGKKRDYIFPNINLLVICFFLFFASNTLAQDVVTDEASNSEKSVDLDEAKIELFSQLEKIMVVAENVEGQFSQRKFISVLPNPLLSKGVFSYGKTTGLDWRTQTPIVSRLVFNEQGIRQDVEGNTVWEIDGMQPAVVSITRVMTGVLSGDWLVLNEFFDISGSVDSQNWELTLTPKDEVIQQLITSLKVSGAEKLKSLTLFESNDDRTEITFLIN